nr:uncharacterized protein LOC126533303 isoform X2 [Dermacentor andersoni]
MVVSLHCIASLKNEIFPSAYSDASGENAWIYAVLVGNDILVWATLAVSESNCSTATPFVVGTCVANKPSRKCTMATYVGSLGVHLSTQYYYCT